MIRLMKAFRHLMKIYDVKHCRACATSAMRDAKNGMDIIKQIEKKTGVHIDIIDGQEEAKIIYNNHVEHMEDQKGNYMYVDVGGGSTEINLLSEGQLVCSRSYNIGTVRMLNNAVKDSEWERLKMIWPNWLSRTRRPISSVREVTSINYTALPTRRTRRK